MNKYTDPFPILSDLIVKKPPPLQGVVLFADYPHIEKKELVNLIQSVVPPLRQTEDRIVIAKPTQVEEMKLRRGLQSLMLDSLQRLAILKAANEIFDCYIPEYKMSYEDGFYVVNDSINPYLRVCQDNTVEYRYPDNTWECGVEASNFLNGISYALESILSQSYGFYEIISIAVIDDYIETEDHDEVDYPLAVRVQDGKLITHDGSYIVQTESGAYKFVCCNRSQEFPNLLTAYQSYARLMVQWNLEEKAGLH